MNAELQKTLGEYADLGFELKEPDDHFLELYFKGQKIATYNASKVTGDIIAEGCRNYLTNFLRYEKDKPCY